MYLYYYAILYMQCTVYHASIRKTLLYYCTVYTCIVSPISRGLGRDHGGTMDQGQVKGRPRYTILVQELHLTKVY